jgi:hypothetical protein
MRKASWLFIVPVLGLLAAPLALAADSRRDSCKDCEEKVEREAMRDDRKSRASTHDDAPRPTLPPPRDRVLETTLAMEAIDAFTERLRQETLDGPTSLAPEESASFGTISVAPRGGGMMTARQRAERQVRTVIRRLR